MECKLDDLRERYDLELNRIVGEIEKQGVRSVLLQLPDGLKPYALVLVDYLEEETGVDVRIWLGDCFGACDLPETNCDLVVQFGHAEWKGLLRKGGSLRGRLE
jgi:2-(3-amino-3-carboxypropyl)histidine synthase